MLDQVWEVVTLVVVIALIQLAALLLLMVTLRRDLPKHG